MAVTEEQMVGTFDPPELEPWHGILPKRKVVVLDDIKGEAYPGCQPSRKALSAVLAREIGFEILGKHRQDDCTGRVQFVHLWFTVFFEQKEYI